MTLKNKLGLRQRIALELDRVLRKHLVEEHPLQQLFWECTLRCGLSCRHCGSDCKTETLHPDMPKEDFLRVLDGIKDKLDPHKCMIIFSGGEPLMRKDLEECGIEVYKRGFPWGMVTNGMLLTEARFKSLLKSGLRSITVSFDGFEEDHNWMRGNPKSFENALRAIQMFVRTPNLTWDIVTCVNQRNIKRLDEFADYLVSIGVKRWRLATIFPAGRAAGDPELQISQEQYRQVLDLIVRLREEGKIHASFACEGFLGGYEGKVRDYLYRCAAGVTVASIRIDGSISGCTSVRGRFDQGNIYQDDFWEVWQNRFQEFRDRSWAKQGACADCKFFRYCEGNGMHLYDDNRHLAKCNLPYPPFAVGKHTAE
ncbi:MAG: TIGR04133 family radical SAM/SPASM protein [Paludibacteraceae bacterium]|nr:TIGR04133 family radical SAM/SPASM protein [Paludibacteraceae bacterium]